MESYLRVCKTDYKIESNNAVCLDLKKGERYHTSAIENGNVCVFNNNCWTFVPASIFETVSELFTTDDTKSDEDKYREQVVEEVFAELTRATAKFARFNSTHEGYAIIKEELEELWEEIKKNNTKRVRKEAIQVAAMAFRFLLDLKLG